MSASLKIDKRPLDRLIAQIEDGSNRAELARVPQSRAVGALIGQAIADNFAKEGPGWKPLKSGLRPILERSGLLKKTVTTPGVRGNVFRVENDKLIWGTDLVYAGIHNHGGVIKFPGTNNGFGRKGVRIPAHQIRIPKRTFLTLRAEWKKRVSDFIAEGMFTIVTKKMFRGFLK